MNGFSAGEEDSRGPQEQVCCLVDDGFRCHRPAGNASYSKRIQKTVTQRRLKLHLDLVVCIIIFYFGKSGAVCNTLRYSRLAMSTFAIITKVLFSRLGPNENGEILRTILMRQIPIFRMLTSTNYKCKP